MSYFYRMKLTVLKQDNESPDLLEVDAPEVPIATLRQECPDARLAIDELGDTQESSTWYTYVTDLINLSYIYPDFTFKLEVEGESNGDCNIDYYRNGSFQRLQGHIMYPDYDPEGYGPPPS